MQLKGSWFSNSSMLIAELGPSQKTELCSYECNCETVCKSLSLNVKVAPISPLMTSLNECIAGIEIFSCLFPENTLGLELMKYYSFLSSFIDRRHERSQVSLSGWYNHDASSFILDIV